MWHQQEGKKTILCFVNRVDVSSYFILPEATNDIHKTKNKRKKHNFVTSCSNNYGQLIHKTLIVTHSLTTYWMQTTFNYKTLQATREFAKSPGTNGSQIFPA